ncbi:MAG TPA: ornithine decarboxylase [Planctomycetota bacterium]
MSSRTPPSAKQAAPAKADHAFRDHYAASQFRTETWNHLKVQTESMYRAASRDEDVEALREDVARTLALLNKIEHYWAFPGRRTCAELTRLCTRGWFRTLASRSATVVRLLVSDAYRHHNLQPIVDETAEEHFESPDAIELTTAAPRDARPYFEVLVVDDLDPAEEQELRNRLLAVRGEDDEFIYTIVVVPSLEDAVIATMFNHNVQSCVVRYRFPIRTRLKIPELRHYLRWLDADAMQRAETDPSGVLGETLKHLRPVVDLFKVTDETLGSVSASRARCFRRVFYLQEDHLELHLSILKGIRERYDAPFFMALREYSQKPTGVFHALPISRGKSITNSHWIQDMGRFYGRNIFLAETSSTTGGLDSLLQPTGPLKVAQEKVARAFGSRQSFLVTNGTSTANKIVTQALVRPGDLVMLSHDCHKSHPYALVLAGALPVYMDAYPLNEYSMFGAVPLRDIKGHLFRLKAAGKLDKVRMLLLTSSTFDGLVYDPVRVMREVLAIKPDMIFLWDEAWFAFARATPTYRRRTAMFAAGALRKEFRSEQYRERWNAWKRDFDELDADAESTWTDHELLPDPDRARLRVYATHSTHKTLTSLRQGSMIHVYDQDFEEEAHEAFHEAYMTHTSTSPNYQILASLDIGRRQLEFEGYEMVRNSIGLAMMLRKQIVDHPLLHKYFTVLRVKDMIPEELRESGMERFYDPEHGFTGIDEHWLRDEIALDPTRLTLGISATGMDGDTFRKMLMNRFDIQVNKTSRNTVLFMLNIGSTRGATTYLLDVLLQIAEELETADEEDSKLDRAMTGRRVLALSEQLPPLPAFSHFHPAFVPDPRGGTPEGDMRTAFFFAYDKKNCEHLAMDDEVAAAIRAGRTLVSASFVTPYPPGFPVLVPGQEVTQDILDYLNAVDVKEIHGYDPEHGLRIFRQAALDSLMPKPAPQREAQPQKAAR